MAAGRLLLPSWMPALDSDGNPIPNAKVFFYANLTTLLAPVFSDEALTTPLANPVEANASGRFPAIWADDSTLYSASVEAPYGPAGVPFTYDNLSVSIGADILIAGAAEAAANEAEASAAEAAQSLSEINDIIENAPDAPSVANKADKDGLNVIADIFKQGARITAPNISAAKALPGGATRSIFIESRATLGDGYGGVFEWTAGDQSANVTDDPVGGVWLAPSSGPSGSAGAWKRVFSGALDPAWFGGRTSAAINAALAFARATGYGPIIGSGMFACTETIGYAGGPGEGPSLDLSGAVLSRAGDYGPTVYFRGLPNGSPLERATVRLGRVIDANNAMTSAVSKAHLVLDNVNFVTWSVEEIVGGCGGVRLLGCATDIQEGRASWRFGSAYRGSGSVGYYKGPSLIAPAIYGGDSAINGTLDIYAGDLLRRTGSTSGSSTTVTISTNGVQIGDIVTGDGTIGDPYALIPDGTTVTAAAGTTITLSSAVTLPASTPLIFYRPALDDGFRIESCDGLWGEGFVHVISAKENSFRFGSDREFYNVRLKFMADFGPGNSILFEGTAPIAHSTFYSHNQYGPTVGASLLHSTTVLESDNLRSNRGYAYGELVEASGGIRTNVAYMRAVGGYSEQRWQTEAGVLRYNNFFDEAAETLVMRAHNASGVSIGNPWTIDPNGRLVSLGFPLQHAAAAVSELSSAPYTGYYDGTEILCYDCRVLTSGGALQGPGAGTGGKLWKNGGNWYVVGTNILAQA